MARMGRTQRRADQLLAAVSGREDWQTTAKKSWVMKGWTRGSFEDPMNGLRTELHPLKESWWEQRAVTQECTPNTWEAGGHFWLPSRLDASLSY